ncbi:MAG: DUF2059 domain-containing protein [Acidibrevibacterium sp.]|uniref:DUF2059 domain-containing protein n=1 Tax=Acidibrevibacterium sp. TaxID=2606776 RepID=UPI003D033B6F
MMPSPPLLRAALRRAAFLALMLAAIASRPAGADEAAMREATALADLTASEATMAPVLALMRERLITILTAAGAPSVDEAGKIVDTLLMPEFRAGLPDLKHQIAMIWAGALSAADLRAVTAFYQTPAGQHLLAATPAITGKSIQAGMIWGQKIAREAVQKHADELRKRGIRV